MKNIWVSVWIYLLLRTDCPHANINIWKMFILLSRFIAYFFLSLNKNNKIDFLKIHTTSMKNRFLENVVLLNNVCKQFAIFSWQPIDFLMNIIYWCCFILKNEGGNLLIFENTFHQKFVLKFWRNEKNIKYWYFWILKYFFFYKNIFLNKEENVSFVHRLVHQCYQMFELLE